MYPRVTFSQVKDTLYFYNKTKIVGELLKISLARIQFDADGVGIISIKNSKVQSINASSRSFRIETTAGAEVQGYLGRSPIPGSVIVISTQGTSEMDIDDIANLVYFGTTILSRFTGNLSAGYTYTKSSKIGRLNINGTIAYNTAKGQTQLDGDLIMTSDSTKAYVERANLAASHEHTFAPLWAAVVIVKYQRNLELGLERRWQQGIGIGKEFVIDQHQQAIAIGGVAINQERNQEDTKANTTEAMLQMKYNFFSFSRPSLTVSFVETAYVSLTEANRIRLDGDITTDYEIVKDFYVSLEFYHNYDSRSPGTGDPNIDFGFVAGLRFKF
ncbi:MAG TPA: DUF481 domain-containing protein [Chryseolinea sp.]|nr:DUF481 domain-containing protein [Chryseolinea sp.]